MIRKLSVIAVEMPARDQPVAVDIGSRNTASENIAPMATQVISGLIRRGCRPPVSAGPPISIDACISLPSWPGSRATSTAPKAFL